MNSKEKLTGSDEWSSLAKFLGEMIAKYAEVIDIDSLPDPQKYLAFQNMREQYLKYIKESTKNRTKKHLLLETDYGIINPK